MPLTETVIEVYTATLNSTGSGNPTQTILHSTLPTGTTITWLRTLEGIYTGTISPALETTRSVVFINCADAARNLWARMDSASQVTITQKSYATGALIDTLNQVNIEIRSYN